MNKPKCPKFATEAEEAQWWYDNREAVSDELVRASREGRLGEGPKARQERRMKEALEKSAA